MGRQDNRTGWPDPDSEHLHSWRVSVYRRMGDGSQQRIAWQIWFSADSAELYADAWLNADDTLDVRIHRWVAWQCRAELVRYS